MSDHSLFFRVDDIHFCEPVDRLNIGDTCAVLNACGIHTLGQLFQKLEIEPRGIRGIKSLRPGDINRVSQRLAALSDAVDNEGRLDWAAFERACSDNLISTLPPTTSNGTGSSQDSRDHFLPPGERWVPSRKLVTGRDFIDSFPEVIRAIIHSRPSEVERLILTERLSREPHKRKTLEEIASQSEHKITRERIRQREQKLIDALAAALIHGRHRRLGVYFHPSFSHFWKVAAEWFGQKNEVSFWEFVEGLAEAWSVSPEDITSHLPLILGVLTRKATLPSAIREQMKAQADLSPKLLSGLSEKDCDTPLGNLSLGKMSRRLVDQGMVTVGDLISGVRSGATLMDQTANGRLLRKCLTALGESLSETGQVDWLRYRLAMGFVPAPVEACPSARDFLTSLRENVLQIIRSHKFTRRSEEIFRLRIAIARNDRATLAQAANALGTHAPTIKREESIMLRALNDLLVQRDFTYAANTFSPDFLNYWAQAREFFRSGEKDFSSFCNELATSWSVPLQYVVGPAEILWAVLNEYPRGRPRQGMTAVARTSRSLPPRSSGGVIVLRGFRRVH